MSKYDEFLNRKAAIDVSAQAIDVSKLDFSGYLFDFQKVIVKWALRRGRACIFADCGLGKSLLELEWSRHVHNETDEPILVLAPLAVSRQIVQEGKKFDISVNLCRKKSDVINGINITNYEMLHHFDTSVFSGVVADESGVMKNFEGKLRNQIISEFKETPFKLAGTATPAPNDFMELGNHAEFMGVMTRTEMLSMFFTHDGGRTSQWRLKRHAEDAFWRWVASWAVCIRKPSDLGFSNEGFDLPKLTIKTHIIKSDLPIANTLTEQRQARKASMQERIEACAETVNDSDEPWIVWCDMNDEGNLLKGAIEDSVQVAGSDKSEHKESRMLGFSAGKHRVLVSKPRIAGWGMNWQHCNNVAFVGLSHSFEAFYQAVRRCWRFGQKKPVNVHIFLSEAEKNVLQNIIRKQREARRLAEGMSKHIAEYTRESIEQITRDEMEYKLKRVKGHGWRAALGDCVEVLKSMPDNSMHYSIFSPPFASLYTYSNSARDMGNCKDEKEFTKHFGFMVAELYRVIKPGRLVSIHCMNLPTFKARDGFIGISDFRGTIIKMFQKAGFIYHSEVCIWKDPVIAVQRTKALGLLHKQLKKDSCMSRQGIPDYLVTMRKPGDNPERVTHTNESFPVQKWQKYASPVWMDINPSNTLTRKEAREEADERHICCLQLDVIERALELWSNPGDWVISPFMGVGSEGYAALKMDRRFVGIELKESYFKQAVINLKKAAAGED